LLTLYLAGVGFTSFIAFLYFIYRMPGEGRHQLYGEFKWQIPIYILVVLVLYLPVLKVLWCFNPLISLGAILFIFFGSQVIWRAFKWRR